jgi:hypothetical protein
LKNGITSKVILAILLLCIITTCLTLPTFQTAKALTTESTLADTLNNIINNVDWNYGNSWTSNWAIILANQGYTAFDNAITQDINRGDYIDAQHYNKVSCAVAYP